jgi:SAM-dependent methyltransferase
MIRTQCAICDTDAWDWELYPETLGADAATYERFSARRIPDGVHYRLVRCRKCGLVRSDPILPDSELARLYQGSSLIYAEESTYAGATYARYLRECLDLLPTRDRLLEIGCGSGFFLERALAFGFAEVYGVEPSREALQHAAPAVRSRIQNEVFREGLFPPDHFSLVCAFQVFDHMADPNAVLQACRRILHPGCLALFINHDAGAWTNRILGERSPIVDIEHIYLYDQRTMARIFRKNGFQVLRVFSVTNSYPLYYWCRMAPLPANLKRKLLPRLKQSRLGRTILPWKAGNLGIVARSADAVQA